MTKLIGHRGFLFCLHILFVVSTTNVHAQGKLLWSAVNESAVTKNAFAGGYKPKAYKLFHLDEISLKAELAGAPIKRTLKNGRASMLVSLPNIDGLMERYNIEEVTQMAPGLAAKYSEIKTYRGQGVDDPTATIGFVLSPYGFRAMITSAKRETFFIDPVVKDNKIYMVFSKKDAGDDLHDFRCYTSKAGDNGTIEAMEKNHGISMNANAPGLKTFRLALTCTGEYAEAFLRPGQTTHHDSITAVLAGMNVLLSRVNQIFEREVGIHLELVDNNDQLIFLNPDDDLWDLKWANTDLRWRSQGQDVINSRITSANYDVGHLLHKRAGGSGVTSTIIVNGNNTLGSACNNTIKGQSISSGPDPDTDPYIVIVTAHEMGHQFGAGHTFTYEDEADHILNASHFEPGSGSTIMSYAGVTLTPSIEVQSYRDNYFHSKSIEQIKDYLNAISCGMRSEPGSSIAIAEAGSDYTIPILTPFTLTGRSSGASATDVVTYSWEQFEVGNAIQTFPSMGETSGPVFRSRYYSTSPSRNFPVLADILSGQNFNVWEVLPAVERQLTFRLTVRTHHSGGGSTTSDDMIISVADNAAGPFKVDLPNSAETWKGDTLHTIKWDNGNTTSAPVNCQSVKISLSTDGGLTFPIVLSPSTPNDGFEELTIPNRPTTTARIKIEAVGNIFFDISDQNFTITENKQQTIVKTDRSWKASNSPEGDWTSPGFDDTGWYFASERFTGIFDGKGGAQFIWGDYHNGDPNDVYFRKQFVLGDLKECYLLGHTEDDDAEVYINGVLVSSDLNNLAGPNVTNIDIRPYLVANATNVVAVKALNTQCCFFGFYLQVLAGGNKYYADADGDGFGNPNITQSSCTTIAGYVLDNSDCNDNDATIHPGEEICNNIDDNCNGYIDEGLGLSVYYQDLDGDGFGSGISKIDCKQPEGYVIAGDDCDDLDNFAWRSGTLYADADGDGYTSNGTYLCYGLTIPPGYSEYSSGYDCDDADNTVWTIELFYRDIDGDGYTTSLDYVCYGNSLPPGYQKTTLGYDCDDEDGAKWLSSFLYVDNDGDGYTSGYAYICYGENAPAGYSFTSLGPDCNDANSTIWVCVSANADLSNLEVSQGMLEPAFVTATTGYTVFAPNDVASLSVTATLADGTATIRINGMATQNATPSDEIALNPGSNAIEVVVTAQDGTTVKTYTIVVTREVPPVITFNRHAGKAANKDGPASSPSNPDYKTKQVDRASATKDIIIIYPNPVTNSAIIKLTTTSRSTLMLRLQDSKGRLVVIKETYVQAGENSFSVDMSNLAPGIYFALIVWGNNTRHVRVVKQ